MIKKAEELNHPCEGEQFLTFDDICSITGTDKKIIAIKSEGKGSEANFDEKNKIIINTKKNGNTYQLDIVPQNKKISLYDICVDKYENKKKMDVSPDQNTQKNIFVDEQDDKLNNLFDCEYSTLENFINLNNLH